ncbi:mannan-binding lectin serine protease 1 isoform X1 [Nematostella vectensis]|uniref:mannan-binding lectin serine protease 1 isoform X1 n=2 Tax=Nematostella vectensis TaxID=45351 RepID=UPI00138FCB99|nr:mannan-binding lectin serine protease 1 isoform X1 [Nematostella vectensis]
MTIPRLVLCLVVLFEASSASHSSASCGGNITGYFGVINTPNFPSTYPNFAHCVWNIKVPKGLQVRIRFTDFDVESFFKCEYDWVMMRANNRSSKKYCGNKSKHNPYKPRTLTAPGNEASLVFHSDYSNEEKYIGFSAHFVAIDPDECATRNGGCDHHCHNYLGGHYCSCRAGYRLQQDKVSCNVMCNNQQFSARRGEISSPEFPKVYPKNSNCDWTITVEKGYLISLHFREFDIESHPDVPCPYDYIKVSAGIGRRYGPLCGQTPPRNITSTGNFMHIEFVSDPSGSNKGFRAYYETHGIRCPELGAPEHGHMRSSGFSFKDTLQFKCDPGYRIRGSAVRECLNSGGWSGVRTSCQPISCGNPGEPSHGSAVSRQYTYKATTNYKCNHMFSLHGDQTRTCQADGSWSGTVPKCIPVCGRTRFNSTRRQQCRQRIVGGHDTVKGAYPWHVLIRKGGHVACGGSLISEKWVLTAAHCVTHRNGNILPRSRFQVQLGLYRTTLPNEPQVQLRNISEIRTHPQFDHVLFDADLALIKLDGEAIISEYVRPICLPETDDQASLISPSKFGMAVGWGKTVGRQGDVSVKNLADALKETCMPIVNSHVCNQAFQDEGYSVTPNMFCAGQASGGKDICQGDSGGGFVLYDSAKQKWFLGGVVSWGSSLGCGLPNKYGVYVRVTQFLGWIRTRMI